MVSPLVCHRNNMLIYERYIIKSVITPLFYCVVILTGMAWLTQVLRMLFLFEKFVVFQEFIFITSLIIPSLINSILPFAVLYSSLFAFNNLKINKEIIVLESAGLDRKKLVLPLLKLYGSIALIALLNSSLIMPYSYNILKDKLHLYKSTFASSVVEEGIFNSLSKNVVLYLNKKTNDNKLEGIVIFDYRNGNHSVILAKEGKMLFKKDVPGIYLTDGNRQSFNQNGAFEVMNFDKFRVNLAKEKLITRDFDDKDTMELYIWELLSPWSYTSKPPQKFLAEGNGRVIWALMNILAPISAICIFLRADFNRKSYTKYIIKSFVYSLVFVAMHFIFLSLSAKNSLYIFACYGNLIVGFLFFYFLTYTERFEIRM